MNKYFWTFFKLPFRVRIFSNNTEEKEGDLCSLIFVYLLTSLIFPTLYGLIFSFRYKPSLGSGYPIIGYFFLPIVMFLGDVVLFILVFFLVRFGRKDRKILIPIKLFILTKFPSTIFSFLLNRVITSPFFFLSIIWQLSLIGSGYRSLYDLRKLETFSTMFLLYVIYSITMMFIDQYTLQFFLTLRI